MVMKRSVSTAQTYAAGKHQCNFHSEADPIKIFFIQGAFWEVIKRSVLHCRSDSLFYFSKRHMPSENGQCAGEIMGIFLLLSQWQNYAYMHWISFTITVCFSCLVPFILLCLLKCNQVTSFWDAVLDRISILLMSDQWPLLASHCY